MTLRTVLLSIQAMLSAAEPDDPQDAVVAEQVRIALAVATRTDRNSQVAHVVVANLGG